MPVIPRWRYCGTLDAPHLHHPEAGGTYLFVYRAGERPVSPPRIVYVGTAKRFATRLDSHRKLFLNGERTMWKPASGQDIYDLMTLPSEAYATHEDVWIPGRAAGQSHYGHDWALWQNGVASYLQALHVWTCETDAKNALTLESALQLSLTKRFGLGYYTQPQAQSWLGKVEQPDAPKSGWICPGWPSVESETHEVFAAMSGPETLDSFQLPSGRHVRLVSLDVRSAVGGVVLEGSPETVAQHFFDDMEKRGQSAPIQFLGERLLTLPKWVWSVRLESEWMGEPSQADVAVSSVHVQWLSDELAGDVAARVRAAVAELDWERQADNVEYDY